MTPFEAYGLYVSLKNHFNSSKYDFFKYNGKSTVTRQSFDKRNDKFFFEKLAKHEDPRAFLLSNFLVNKKGWIKQLSYGEEARKNYEEWLRKQQAMDYNLKVDLSKLDEDFDSNFTVESNGHPKIIRLYMAKQVSLETLCILCDMVGCMKYWDKSMKDDPVWEELSTTIKKYLPFLHYDKEKTRQACLDTFSL